jgi:hypothetical protein
MAIASTAVNHNETAPAAVVPPGANPESASYVEWGAIIAGAIMATAISGLLFSFGSAIGLSLTSAWPGEGMSARFFLLAITIWVVWVQVSSFFAGGYLAGRMRRRVGDGVPEEVEMRDGSHGLMVWALGVVIGGVLLASAATGTLRAGADATARLGGGALAAAGGVAGGAAAATQGRGGAADPMGYVVDSLFRPATTPAAAAAGTTAMPGATGTATGGVDPADRAAGPATWQARQEVMRILLIGAAQGQVSPEDKAYIGRVVADRTGMAPADAEKRVTDVLARADATAKAAETAVRDAAEKARKGGMMLAFIAVAAMLVSGAAAWWAAKLGGKHRDEGTQFGRYFRFYGA